MLMIYLAFEGPRLAGSMDELADKAWLWIIPDCIPKAIWQLPVNQNTKKWTEYPNSHG